MKWFWRTVKEANSPNSCLNWDSSVVDRLIGRLQGAHGERVAGFGVIHGEDGGAPCEGSTDLGINETTL